MYQMLGLVSMVSGQLIHCICHSFTLSSFQTITLNIWYVMLVLVTLVGSQIPTDHDDTCHSFTLSLFQTMALTWYVMLALVLWWSNPH